MSLLKRKYPFQPNINWVRDCLLYCLLVFLILYFLQPFGFNGFGGNKLLASLIFGAVTFCACVIYYQLVFNQLQRKVKIWRIWHQTLTILGMIFFIGLCNFVTFALILHLPYKIQYFMMFLYWTLIIGIVITVIAVSISYHRSLRNQLDTLINKTTQEQEGISVTIHDTRILGNDICIPLNDLLYIEAQKNKVAIYYLKNGKLTQAEIQSTLVSVMEGLADYVNIFQCHRSFAVNLNNITSAKGNSNGYTLQLNGGMSTVPVSRSYVPKLRSFIA